MFETVAACALVAALSQAGALNHHVGATAAPSGDASVVATNSAAAAATSPALPSPFESAAPIAVQADVAGDSRPRIPPATDSSGRRSAALVGLYASFATLEVLDIHSTLRAVGNGASEANPAMQGVVSNDASFIAVKAATGGLVIWMAEKMRKQHPALAIAMMVGLNSAMATVVAHNYSIR